MSDAGAGVNLYRRKSVYIEWRIEKNPIFSKGTRMTPHIEVVLIRDGEVLLTQHVNGRPIVIGRSPGSDLHLPGNNDDWHQALLWTEDGKLWIKDLDSSSGIWVHGERVARPVTISSTDPVRLGDDTELKVRDESEQTFDRYPYRLTVTFQGATGPEAVMEDLKTGRSCVIRSNNRVSVLYLLARQLDRDNTEEKALDDLGWCSDEAIACGVWGRNWKKQIKSHLYVLVHRIRKELKAAGLDPRCIEKRRRHTRTRIVEAVVK